MPAEIVPRLKTLPSFFISPFEIAIISTIWIRLKRRESMKAIVCTKYGPPDVLQIQEIEKPVPKNNEVLVRIKATTVDTGGYTGPRLPGPSVLLGPGSIGPRRHQTEETRARHGAGRCGRGCREGCQNFKVGDQVFALTGHDLGCYAEYRCVPEGGIISRKPVNLSFEEAAAIPMGGLTALHFLREGKVGEGRRYWSMAHRGASGPTPCSWPSTSGRR